MKQLQFRLQMILALTRRDYVVQFAGAGLGIGWLFIQYLFQIALFFLIFGVILGSGSELQVQSRRLTGPGFLNYLLAAMTIWLPLSEMIMRSGSILSENRSLIRRTPGALAAMSWIPLVQAAFHFFILFLASVLITMVWESQETPSAWISAGMPPQPYSPRAVGLALAFLSGLLFLILVYPLCLYLQRISVLLKDLSPILRLLLQVLFWGTPMVYIINDSAILGFMAYNPLFCMVDIQRFLTYGLPLQTAGAWPGLYLAAPVSIAAGALSRFRLKEVSMDFL